MKVFKRIIKITVLCFLLIACSYSIFIIYRLNYPIYEEVGLEILTTTTNTKFDASGNPYFVVGGTIQEVKREKDTTLVTVAEPKYFQFIKSDRYELQNKVSAGDYELYKICGYLCHAGGGYAVLIAFFGILCDDRARNSV